MQKIVIDTNVLVSALIQRSFPHLIVSTLFIEDKIALCISAQLLEEYYEVLKRKKFSKYPDFIAKAEMLLATIETHGILYKPKIKIKFLRDKDDNKLLELTEECNADYLITGNTNDFTITKYKKTKIVSPKEY